jgi:hypothetical protein
MVFFLGVLGCFWFFGGWLKVVVIFFFFFFFEFHIYMSFFISFLLISPFKMDHFCSIFAHSYANFFLRTHFS